MIDHTVYFALVRKSAFTPLSRLQGYLSRIAVLLETIFSCPAYLLQRMQALGDHLWFHGLVNVVTDGDDV
jgi:hypothetical protein